MIATRAAALHHLEPFLPYAGRDYAATRNYDRGPADRSNVSLLSPYIRTRLITEAEVLQAVLARHTLSAAQKFVQEVFWRTYWKGWLESRPIVWTHYRDALDALYARLACEPELARAHAAALAGRTGIAAFDGWSAELTETGYLHNHARMWFASIWIFTLGLPWALGADFFMRHLYCGDPAVNTLSWRWVAGLQTRGKTYLATRANIQRYTDGRVDTAAPLARSAVALDGPAFGAGPLPVVPLEIAPGDPVVLLVHDDDLGIDTLALEGLDIRATLGLCVVAGRSPQPMADPVVTFVRAAIADALARAPRGESAIVEVGAPADVAQCLQAARTIGDGARAAGATRVVAPFAPVGPVADALAALRTPLAERGIALHVLGRRYDATAWPYATRGFFHLKDHIPAVLATLGMHAGAGEPSRAKPRTP